MRKRLLTTLALLLMAVTGAWALYLLDGDEWNEYTHTLTVNSNPETFYSSNTEIQRLIISASVTIITDNAFQDCTRLTDVTMGSSVTSIGNWAFKGCTNLVEITIGNGVKSIGEAAFQGTCLQDVTIGSSVESIGDAAFKKCEVLQSITIPASVTSIGQQAFCGCGLLATVSGCDGVTEVGYEAFDNTHWLAYHDDGVIYIGKVAYYGMNVTGEISINDGTVSISDHAFESCTGLTSITIPASVTSIGRYAFYECTGLTSVTIAAGSQLTSISSSAFCLCSSLTSITIPASVMSIGSYAFYGCSNASLNITIQDGITSMGVNAFNQVPSVTYKRTFNCGVAATVCLPFSVTSAEAAEVGKFYTFAGIDKTTNSKWTVVMEETGLEPNIMTTDLDANTPYLFIPDTPTGKSAGEAYEITFSGSVTTTSAGKVNWVEPSAGTWTFQGVYESIKWTDDTTDPEYNSAHAADLSKVYGFAAQNYEAPDDDHDGQPDYTVRPGDFVKAMAGASIAPFRAYLKFTSLGSGSRTRGADELPAKMSVRLVNRNGSTPTAIGTFDTRTGEITFGDEWYSLDGRRLSSKPATKGIYIHNGKVVIKN